MKSLVQVPAVTNDTPDPKQFPRKNKMPYPLTAENYYTHKTDFEYLSFSVFKSFEECEAGALAKLEDKWKLEQNTPLLVGNYVHSYFESQASHHAFIAENRDQMVTKKGTPLAPFAQADKMIKTLSRSEFFNDVYMPGNKEVIVTGTIGGINWKGKIDSLMLQDHYFCDLKTVDKLHKGHFNTEERTYENFILNRKYEMQMAIYQELIYQTFGVMCQPFIFAVSKEKVPDQVALKFTSPEIQARMEEDADIIKRDQDEFWAVMMGEKAPKRCEKCEYCRLTKQLDGFVDVMDLTVD